MKRSGQVALVLMGVTATTAAGAYMLPPRPECRQQIAVEPRAAPLPGAPAQAEPCRRRSWGTWRWGSGAYYSDRRTSPITPTTAFRNSSSRTTSTSTSGTRISTPSRGGFGSIGHSMSRSGGS